MVMNKFARGNANDMIVTLSYKFCSKEDFIKLFVKESEIEFPNYMPDGLKDLLFDFSKDAMKNVYIEETVNKKDIKVNDKLIAWKLLLKPELVTISSKIGLPIEYCYLVLADEELDKKISDDKTLRSELKMRLKQARQDFITQYKLKIP